MIAWWVKGSSSRALTILIATLAGFWVSLIWQGDWQSWWAGVQGKRVDFDYHNAQHTSVYFGWALIAALTWLGHLVSSHGRAWQLSLSVLLSLVALVGVIVTQTRGVWLALAVVFVLIAPYLCYRLFRVHHGKATKPRTLFVMVAIVMAFLAFGATQFDRLIEKRLDKEASVMQTAAELDWDSIPYSSIGIRLHTWRYALEKIAERPLTGWGADSRKYLIDEGPFPQAIRDRFGHFHNSYIEITLAYGLIGLTILGILCGAMWEGVRQAYKRGHRYLATGLACSFVFFAIANLTESYFIFRTGIYFVTIVGGCALSFYLFRPHVKGTEIASPDAELVDHGQGES
nr:O-antigen ligase family protein [Salinicola sp. S1-1-2]